MPDRRPPLELSPPPAPLLRALNPAVRFLLGLPLPGPLRGPLLGRRMVLRFTGRRTGRRYAVPVTAHPVGDGIAALTASGWRHNFRGGHEVEVLHRGRTRPMRGELVEDPATVGEVYVRRIAELGPRRAQRELGLRINVERVPTVEEMAEASERQGFSVIMLREAHDGPAR
ncbi:hypothetical protein ACSNOI_42535 [Actinomadura kijaniata]|uniref:hypothetical protein n=1 Tax=Actinomadura kijaniata TaxID=46161 RepID=UPI003F1BDE7F